MTAATQDLAALAGEGFLRALVCDLSRRFSLDVAAVCQLNIEDLARLDSVAAARAGRALGAVTLAGVRADTGGQAAPLTAVVRGLEGAPPACYLSAALSDSLGREVGALVLLGAPGADLEQAAAALDRWRARAAGELERRQVSAELALIRDAAAALRGGDYLEVAVRGMARALRVRMAFVAEVVLPDRAVARPLAFWRGDALAQIGDYALAGTPCQDVYDASMCFVASGVQGRYPEDPVLAELAADSYIGVAIADADGRAVGHVAVLHDRPLPEGLQTRALFQVFAAMIGSEFARRRAERERVALLERLMEARQRESVGVLAGGVAHEFNNLLMGITGNVSLALERLLPGSPLGRYLARIDEAAREAGEKARQLLAVSGRGRLAVEPLSLSAVVEGVRPVLEAALSGDVSLRWALAAGLPPVEGDAAQLRQAVVNLALNAAEAMPGGGVVTLATAARPDGRVSLEVSDEGCGMDEATLARIFDPLFSTRRDGPGLGLPAVQGIARAHLASVEVHSRPGEGTTVRLSFPAAESQPAPPPAPPEAPLERTRRVLVVDDEDSVRGVVSAMLRHMDLEAVGVSGGREALALFAQDAAFDLVLVDLTMPDMGGDEVILAMHEQRPGVRIVLMSGYSDRGVVPRSLLAGVLQKPFRIQHFRAVINAALDDGRAVDKSPS